MAFHSAEECGVDALLALETGGDFRTVSAMSQDLFMAPKKGKKNKRKKERTKPKKAMTPFMVFSKKTRKSLVQENPKMTFSDIGKELGARWRALGDVGKESFVIEAKADYQRFLDESRHMEALNPGRKRKTIEQKNQTKKKKSISAYLYFCNAHREQVKACHPEMKMVEIQRLLAEKWKKSSPVLRLPFEKQAEADRQKYNSEILQREANAKVELNIENNLLFSQGKEYNFTSMPRTLETILPETSKSSSSGTLQFRLSNSHQFNLS